MLFVHNEYHAEQSGIEASFCWQVCDQLRVQPVLGKEFVILNLMLSSSGLV